MLSDVFDPDDYNALGGPDEAYSELRRRPQFDEFLPRLLALTQASASRECVGALLLHRHFDASASERLVERPVVLDDGTRALITAPSTRTDGVPIRWQLGSDGQFSPLEYSVDTGPRRAVPQLAEDDSLLGSYASLVREYELADVIGLCVVASDHLAPEEGRVLSELTTDIGSVVTLEAEDDDPDSVPTVWAPVINMACKLRCTTNCRSWEVPHGKYHFNRHFSD